MARTEILAKMDNKVKGPNYTFLTLKVTYKLTLTSLIQGQYQDNPKKVHGEIQLGRTSVLLINIDKEALYQNRKV